MELSPEERHKIYLEEKARIEAIARFESEKDASGPTPTGWRTPAQVGLNFDQAITKTSEPKATKVNVAFTSADDRRIARNRGFAALLFFVVVLACVVIAFSSNTTSSSSPAPSTEPLASPASAMIPLTPVQIGQAKLDAQEEKVHEARIAVASMRAQRELKRKQADAERQQAAIAAGEQRDQEAEQQRQAAEDQQDQDAYATIKAKVQNDYPSDYITQKGVYDMAVDAYKYMKTVPDQEIKAKVEQDYPDDYISQKGVYDMDVKAKAEMQ